MSASKLVLYPQEFRGEPRTCVCGRVVLVRGPFELGTKEDIGMSQSPRRTLPPSPGRSQKGRGKRSTKNESEVRKKIDWHLLGGETSADILFWRPGATRQGKWKDTCILGKSIASQVLP